MNGEQFVTIIASSGGLNRRRIITFEESDTVVEVANAMHVKRSIKAIHNPGFLAAMV